MNVKIILLSLTLALGYSCAEQQTGSALTYQGSKTITGSEGANKENPSPEDNFDQVSSFALQVEDAYNLKSADATKYKKLLGEKKGKETWEGTLARIFDDKGLRQSHQAIAEDILEKLFEELHEKVLSKIDEQKIADLIEKIQGALSNVVADKKCGGGGAGPTPAPKPQ